MSRFFLQISSSLPISDLSTFHIHHGCTAIVVELGQDALGEGPPDVTEPDELGLVAIKGGIQLFKM